MKVAIHQPHYFAYPGFFNKLSLADALVVLDGTQYDRRFTNRNRILDTHGPVWLTVPVDKSDRFSPNKEVRINDALPWRQDHWKKLLVSYANAPYFRLYAAELKEFFDTVWPKLIDLDVEATRKVNEWLGIDIPIVMESDLGVSATGSARLAEITKAMGADTYVSGRGGTAYLEEEVFRTAGVALEYQTYAAVPYRQRFGDQFVPDLSILDMLFSLGPRARGVIDASGRIGGEMKPRFSEIIANNPREPLYRKVGS